MKISEFKAKNPAYRDKDDREVAEAIYAKHYDGKLAKTEFLRQVGIEEQPVPPVDDGQAETVERQEAYIEDLRGRLKTSAAELKRVTRELQELTQGHQKLEAESKAAARDAARLEGLLGSLRTSVTAREADLAQARRVHDEHVTAARREAEGLRAALQQLQAAASSEGPRTRQLRATVKHLEAQVEALQQAHTLKDVELVTLRNKPTAVTASPSTRRPWAGTVVVEKTFNNGMAHVMRFEPDEDLG